MLKSEFIVSTSPEAYISRFLQPSSSEIRVDSWPDLRAADARNPRVFL